MANTFSNSLVQAIIRHLCNPLFHQTLHFFFYEILRFRNFLIVGSEWELMRHRLFLPIPGITLFLSSPSLVLFVPSCGSSVQPSTLYFALFRFLFQSHPPQQGIHCFPGSSLLDSMTKSFSFLGSHFQTCFSPISRKLCSWFCGSPSFLLYCKFQSPLPSSQVLIPFFSSSASLT